MLKNYRMYGGIRYGDTIKQSTELYHCRFYACPDPNNFIWITQTQWGNYASSSNTYILPLDTTLKMKYVLKL